jgi:hypothetical protein
MAEKWDRSEKVRESVAPGISKTYDETLVQSRAAAGEIRSFALWRQDSPVMPVVPNIGRA